MTPFELQLLKDARDKGGMFRVQGDKREDCEGFSLVENGLRKLEDRGAVEWIRSVPNGMNRHCEYTLVQVRVTAAGEDFLDAEEENGFS